MLYQDKISSKHSEIILREMLFRVGGDYDSFDFSKENWYLEYQWTEDEQNDFRDWLASKLKKWGYCRGKYRGQDHGIYEANKIVFQYGWKLK